jgi:DNA invertase Pin-like site-specific DNA recombinase
MERRIYAYLRASTEEQDAERAKPLLIEFTEQRNEVIAGWFFENESGARLKRPKLFELLEIMLPNDVILVESIDRLSRLNKDDWEKLQSIMFSKQIKIIAIDMPTTYMFLQAGDEFTQRIQNGFNQMVIEFMAAMARKDYEMRRERQRQGIEKRKAKYTVYRETPCTKERDSEALDMLKAGIKESLILKAMGISRTTLWRIKKKHKDELAVTPLP